MEIIFRPLEIDVLPELRIWFVDSELSRRLAFPSDTWFKYVTTGDDAHCWVAMHSDDIIAEVQVDRDGAERGYLDLAVPTLGAEGSAQRCSHPSCPAQGELIRSWRDA